MYTPKVRQILILLNPPIHTTIILFKHQLCSAAKVSYDEEEYDILTLWPASTDSVVNS